MNAVGDTESIPSQIPIPLMDVILVSAERSTAEVDE
jgi:hypothetical protein